MNLEVGQVGVVFFGFDCFVKEGEIVKCIGEIVDVFVGFEFFGCVVDVFGNFIDGKGFINIKEKCCVQFKVFGIFFCKFVNQFVQIGFKFIDVMVFIGCGQCELIIGDCQIGKIVVVFDVMFNQKWWNSGNDEIKKFYCIYVVVGQKCFIVVQFVKIFEENDVMKYFIVVVVIVFEVVVCFF